MEFEIKEFGEFIFITRDGSDREVALKELEDYLGQKNIASQGYYFIEVYNHAGVSGAMALAKVDSEPEHDRKFRSSTLKPGKYLVFDYPYEDFVENNKPGSGNKMDVKPYIKEQGYSVAGFPFFEFLPESDNRDIRVYVPLK